MKFNIRNTLAFLYSGLLINLGFVKKAASKALAGEYIISVYFHAPDKKLFESVVRWFLKRGFHFISLKELEAIINGAKPFPKGAVILTVDDGWKTNVENIIPIANKYHIPVTIFVATGPVTHGTFWWSYVRDGRKMGITDFTIEDLKKLPNHERVAVIDDIKESIQLERQALTRAELQQIASSPYITIAAHTVSHPILTSCDDPESFNEIKESKTQLEEWTDKSVEYFSFPNGDFSEREIGYLRELNFQMSFTTQEFYLDRKGLHHRYQLPRFYIYENASMAENICRMTGVWNKSIFKKSM